MEEKMSLAERDTYVMKIEKQADAKKNCFLKNMKLFLKMLNLIIF